MRAPLALFALLLAAPCGCAEGLPLGEDPGPDAGPTGGPADQPTAEPDASPDPGSKPEPDPPPDPSPDPPPDCTPQWIDLLVNGTFEAGPSSWEGDVGVIETYDPKIIPAQGGQNAAWLAGFNLADQVLAQEVTVPASATALRFGGFRCFVSGDPSANDDVLQVQLRSSSSGALLESLAVFTNQDAGTICNWESFTLAATNAHAGEALRLLFHATNSAAAPTSFHLDTLRLEALACP